MTVPPLPDLGTTVGVMAHPDDLFYAAAGLLSYQRLIGNVVVSVSATRGEAGSQDLSRWPKDQMAALREQEERNAFGFIDVKDIRYLAHPNGSPLPDGGLNAVKRSFGANLVLAQLRSTRAHSVITFGPDGGHPDHVAISRWVTMAFASYQQLVPEAQLYYVAATQDWPDIAAVLQEANAIYAPAEIVPDDSLSIDYRLEYDVLMLKYAGIAAYESQSRPLHEAIGDLRRLHPWFRREAFRRVV